MFRPIRRINSKCFSVIHFLSVPMRYAGKFWWNGLPVHVMRCPVCQKEHYYHYTTPTEYVRVK